MEVVILSKTHVGTGACVGGLVLENLQFVRLMRGENVFQPGDTPFQVGQIWDITFDEHPDTPPHVEDVFVQQQNYVRDIENLPDFIRANCEIWNGSPSDLYEGKLKWTGRGSGHLNDKENVPATSVGFWIPDKDLMIEEDKYYVYKYRGPFIRSKRLRYIGFEDMHGSIRAGTLCRVSLAKWWKPPDPEIKIEKRCYLQLSGWYE